MDFNKYITRIRIQSPTRTSAIEALKRLTRDLENGKSIPGCGIWRSDVPLCYDIVDESASSWKEND